MGRVVHTRRSRSELVEILLYIRRDNHSAAKALLRRINQTLELLGDFPKLGTSRPEFGRSIRSLPVGNYLLFYRPVKDGIQLVRVLHGSRDLRRAFKRR